MLNYQNQINNNKIKNKKYRRIKEKIKSLIKIETIEYKYAEINCLRY